MCVSVGWHANNARKVYSNASGRDEDLLSNMDKSNRKVDAALVPGLLAQLAPTVSDKKQRQGLANMLASMPRGERDKALEKVKTMSPSELKERSEVHAQVKTITAGLSDEATAAFFKLLVSPFAHSGLTGCAWLRKCLLRHQSDASVSLICRCPQPNLTGKTRVDILRRLADMKTAGGRAAMIFQMADKLEQSKQEGDKMDSKKTK